MGLLDQIVGSVLSGQARGGASSAGGLGDLLSGLGGGSRKGGGAELITALLPVLVGMLANRGGGGSGSSAGGLDGLLKQFQTAGLGSQVDSWVGTGANMPISADDLMRVFGRDQLAQMAARAGVGQDEAADGLASVLPEFVNQLTPEGEVPPQGQLDDALSSLQRSLGI